MPVLDQMQFDQLVVELREALETTSQGVSEVLLVDTLDNLVSLPALRLIGATETVVEAPIELLSLPAVEAAAETRDAIDDSVVATVDALASADLSDAARKNLEEVKERTVLAGADATIKGDKAFVGAIGAEDATLRAMQLAGHLQTKLEQAQVIILAGEAYEERFNLLDAQVKDSILICVRTREDAYTAILQLRELQKQVAGAILDAYVLYDQMQLSTADTRIATELATRATAKMATLSEQTQRVIVESVMQTGTAKQTVTRIEDLEVALVFSKGGADAAAIRALVQVEQTKKVKEETELVRQEGVLVNAESRRLIEWTEAAGDKALYSAAGASVAGGYATAEADRAKMAADRSNELSDNPPKIIDNLWYKYDETTKQYVSTGLRAKGDTGSSFNIVGVFPTPAALEAAVPDGKDVDGVYAVGAAPPYSYYAWVYQGDAWSWQSQGELQGQRGESAYEAAVRFGYEGTEEAYATDPIIKAKLAEEAADKAGVDVKGFITTADKTVTKTVNRVNTLSDNPQKVIDGVWHKYDEATKAYVTTGIRAVPIDWRVRDLDHVPDEGDVTYHDEVTGLDIAYPIGAEVRVFDIDYEEYSFYKLYDIKDGAAVWDEVGGGNNLPGDILLSSPSTFSSDEEFIFLNNGVLNL